MAYLLKSAAHPETIPACLATIRLIQATNQGFIRELWKISFEAQSIGDQFHKIRQMYEIHDIENKVQNGAISFPEDSRSLASGITVEFRYVPSSSNPISCQAADALLDPRAPRNVSFRYPGKDGFALRDVSFKIEKGQLCVSPTLLTFNCRRTFDS